jgi:hypothetical protein
MLNLEPEYFLSLPFSWSLIDKANSTRLPEPLGKSFVFFIFRNQIIPAPTSSHKSNHSCTDELFADGCSFRFHSSCFPAKTTLEASTGLRGLDGREKGCFIHLADPEGV